MNENMLSSEFLEKCEDFSINGTFQIKSLLHESESGYCRVFLAKKHGKLFVIKTLRKIFAGVDLYEKLLQKEFDISFNLDHPNICRIYELLDIPQFGLSIVMEYIDGHTLNWYIDSKKITPELMSKMISEITSAMDYFHKKQVIHRDIKPENILLTNNGSNIKIIDFGLSDCDEYDLFKSPAGTRFYASPEIVSGRTVDNRTDFYSLGVVIFTICKSCKLPGYYKSLAKRCMKNEPEQRFSEALMIRSYTERAKKLHYLLLLLKTAAVIVTLYLIIISFPGKTVPDRALNDHMPNYPANGQTVIVKQQAPLITDIEKRQTVKVEVTEVQSSMKQLPENSLQNSVIHKSPDDAFFASYTKIESSLVSFREMINNKYYYVASLPHSFAEDSLLQINSLKRQVEEEFFNYQGSWQYQSCMDWAVTNLKMTIEDFRASKMNAQ